jgi:hypothetical protein
MTQPIRFPFTSVNPEAMGIPLLLGQVNFFIEFDICFHRSQLNFEINPKNSD